MRIAGVLRGSACRRVRSSDGDGMIQCLLHELNNARMLSTNNSEQQVSSSYLKVGSAFNEVKHCSNP